MLPVGGRPMIERVLGHLAEHGVQEAVLSLGYRPDAFMSAYPDGACAGVRLVYAVESEPLDTAGAIRFAALEAGVSDTFLVVNGDVLTGLDVSALIDFHRARSAEGTIALTPVEDPSAFGVVPTDESGRVTAFIEKPPRDQAPTNYINAGTYVLEPSVLDRIPGGRRVSIERETFPALVEAGRLYALRSDASWLDAGTPATFLRANLAYADEGGSVVGDGVTLGEGAVLDGSVLFDQAVVGAGCEVRSSIVGRGARLEAGCSLAETVIGDGVVVPAGSRLTNERVAAAS
jgi:mannose-1-phosphate guanylyltransferase